MKKRLLAMLMTVSMILSLTACGHKDTVDDSTSSPVVTATQNKDKTTTGKISNNSDSDSKDDKTTSDTLTSKDDSQGTDSSTETPDNSKNDSSGSKKSDENTKASNNSSSSKTPTPPNPNATTPNKVPTPEETTTPNKVPTPEETTTKKPTVPTNPTEVYGFSVSGTKLLDANGNEFVMRGINHAHTWYKGEKVTALKGIANTGSNTVRIVLSDGGQWSKDSLSSVKSIIEECKKNKLIAVLEVHDATGYNDVASLERATKYWIEIKDALIGNEEYVILNIANEWVGQWSSAIWRDGYVKVIPMLRNAGIKNTIMVDAAGWGQYGKSVADYGKQVFESDKLKNTMFSIHMYGSAGGNSSSISSNLNNVTKQNLCVIVGEFGHNHSDGDVDEAYIMKYCTEKKIGYLGWSWKGNGGGVEYLDIAYYWDGSLLSSDWGHVLINGTNGIKKTSKTCSVFK